MNYLQHTGSFKAIDQFGQKHTLHTFVERISVATFDEPNAMADGIKKLQTENGLHVNRLGKGKYEIAQKGLKLSSNDPNAP